MREIPPALFVQLHIELTGGGADALPGLITFGVAHAFNLVETSDCVSNVLRVMNGFLLFFRERVLAGGNLIAIVLVQLAHGCIRARWLPFWT
jgi:hypothetical protein